MKNEDNRYEYIINNSQDFITLIDKGYVYTVVNDSYCKAICREKDEILNQTVETVWGKDVFDDKLKSFLDKAFAGEEVHYIERFKFGLSQRYMHVSYYPYYSEKEDQITHVCVFSHDITRLGEIETKLVNYEYRDPITGLFNGRSLEIILDMELEKARRSISEKLRAVLYLGVENLTEINRRHGHNIGNILLENVGLKVKEILRTSDYVFRYEGNELVIMLTKLTRNTDAAKVAEKIYEEISTPYKHQEHTISLESYIGISIFPEDGTDRETMLRNAIAALNEAKLRKASYIMYNEDIYEKAVRKLQLERDLHYAFHHDQFQLFYQPIVNKEGVIKGAEALIRWNHPQRGLVSPLDFIPLAEEVGLVGEIGKWALFTAVRQAEHWLALKDDVYVSINLSAPEFENPYLPEIVEAALRQAGNLDPNHLKLEITESEGMTNPEISLSRMEELIDLGIQIYIDDFGTGQSSLMYLKHLPAQVLKIDKAFITEIVDNPKEYEFLKMLIGLAKSRGKSVIIEGVSSKEEFLLVRELDCDLMQGYYFSRPVPLPDFESYLRRGAVLPAPDESDAR